MDGELTNCLFGQKGLERYFVNELKSTQYIFLLGKRRSSAQENTKQRLLHNFNTRVKVQVKQNQPWYHPLLSPHCRFFTPLAQSPELLQKHMSSFQFTFFLKDTENKNRGTSINLIPKTGGQSALSYRKPFRTHTAHMKCFNLTAIGGEDQTDSVYHTYKSGIIAKKKKKKE
jgi:hypothetical protein